MAESSGGRFRRRTPVRTRCRDGGWPAMSGQSTHAPAPAVASPLRAGVRIRDSWFDRFVASDPGLGRLRFALHNTVTIAAILGAEWLFVHFTRALQIRTHGAHLAAVQAAQIAGFDRYLLI